MRAAAWLVIGVVGLGGFGCGKKGPDADKVKAGVDVAAVNALVPKERKLEFESVVTDKQRAVAVLPKGWQKGFLKGEIKPPDGGGFGFFTSFRVSTSCDGECTSKDWEKVLQEGHLKRFAGDKPSKNEKVGDSGWLVVRPDDNAKTVVGLYVQWHKGGAEYQTCEFTLSEEDASLEPAFEKACTSLVGLRFDSRD
jgi:hypothetical protein